MPLKARALEFGKAATVKQGDPLIVASFGGANAAQPVHVVAKRQFAGNWEYMVENAIFTAPPHPMWSGAALINHSGQLVGVGSLIVGDTSGTGDGMRGNMFVPIDACRRFSAISWQTATRQRPIPGSDSTPTMSAAIWW